MLIFVSVITEDIDIDIHVMSVSDIVVRVMLASKNESEIFPPLHFLEDFV